MTAQPPSDEATAARVGPPRWLLLTIALLAVAALAFSAGRFSTFTTNAPAAAPGTHSADAGFARDMQVHHQQAVEMALIAYRATEDDTVRTMATDIITAQSAQAGEMFGWLVDWGLTQSGDPLMTWMERSAAHDHHGGEAATDEQRREAMGLATPAQLDALRAASGVEGDCLFLELMIAHHEGALDMVDAIEDLGSQERVRDVARSMAEVQGAEIDAMTEMRAGLGCTG